MQQRRPHAEATPVRVRFRDARQGDRDAILDLWVAAWSAAMPQIEFAPRRGWFAERLAELHRRGFVLRCLEELDSRAILGFTAISPELRYLDQIALAPARWGSGQGGALIAEAKRLSPDGVALDVNQANPRAVAFYEKHDFRRLRAGRNPSSGLATWRYAWLDADPAIGF